MQKVIQAFFTRAGMSLIKISKAGVTEDLFFHERRKIILLNSMCMLGIGAFLFFLVINLVKQIPLTFLITNLLAHSIFITTILLNHKRKYKAANLFCNIVILAYVNVLTF